MGSNNHRMEGESWLRYIVRIADKKEDITRTLRDATGGSIEIRYHLPNPHYATDPDYSKRTDWTLILDPNPIESLVKDIPPNEDKLGIILWTDPYSNVKDEAICSLMAVFEGMGNTVRITTDGVSSKLPIRLSFFMHNGTYSSKNFADILLEAWSVSSRSQQSYLRTLKEIKLRR